MRNKQRCCRTKWLSFTAVYYLNNWSSVEEKKKRSQWVELKTSMWQNHRPVSSRIIQLLRYKLLNERRNRKDRHGKTKELETIARKFKATSLFIVWEGRPWFDFQYHSDPFLAESWCIRYLPNPYSSCWQWASKECHLQLPNPKCGSRVHQGPCRANVDRHLRARKMKSTH